MRYTVDTEQLRDFHPYLYFPIGPNYTLGEPRVAPGRVCKMLTKKCYLFLEIFIPEPEEIETMLCANTSLEK